MTGVQHKIVGTGFGVAAAYYAVSTGNELGALMVGTAIVGSLLPDIDHDSTKIGRKRKFITELSGKLFNVVFYGGIVLAAILIGLTYFQLVDFGVNIMQLAIGAGGFVLIILLKKFIQSREIVKWAEKHRGLMHTLIPPGLILFAAMSTQAPIIHWSLMGVFVGYISHLFADCCTVAGCPLLFPLTRINIRILRFRTESNACNVCAVVLAILAVGGTYAWVRFLL